METLIKIMWVGVLVAAIAVVNIINVGEAKKMGKQRDAREEEIQALQGDIENGVSPSFIMPRLMDLLHRVSRDGTCPECPTKRGCRNSGGTCQTSSTSCNGTTVNIGCPGDDCECCIPNPPGSGYCKPRRSCRRLHGTCMANCDDCKSPDRTIIYAGCRGNCFCCAPSTRTFPPIPSPTTLTTLSSRSFEPTTGGITSSSPNLSCNSGPFICFPATSGPFLTTFSPSSSSSSFAPTPSSSSRSSSITTPVPTDPPTTLIHTTTRAATPRPSTSFTSSSIYKPETISPASSSSPTTPANIVGCPSCSTTTTTTSEPTTTTASTTSTPQLTPTTTSKATTPEPTTTSTSTATTPQPPTTTPAKDTTINQIRCAPNFFQLGNECFQVVTDEVSWGFAELLCPRLDSKHAYLAKPEDSAALAKYMFDNGYSRQHHYWMGGRGDGFNIRWRKTGEIIPPYPSEPWEDGQPDGVSRNDCLDLRIDFVTIPQELMRPLAVHNCNMAAFHCYICESDLRL